VFDDEAPGVGVAGGGLAAGVVVGGVGGVAAGVVAGVVTGVVVPAATPPVVDVEAGGGVVETVDVGTLDNEPLVECGPKYGLPVQYAAGVGNELQ
jgi:hypothetical protein